MLITEGNQNRRFPTEIGLHWLQKRGFYLRKLVIVLDALSVLGEYHSVVASNMAAVEWNKETIQSLEFEIGRNYPITEIVSFFTKCKSMQHLKVTTNYSKDAHKTKPNLNSCTSKFLVSENLSLSQTNTSIILRYC